MKKSAKKCMAIEDDRDPQGDEKDKQRVPKAIRTYTVCIMFSAYLDP